tara:strand:- start:3973 stop:4152 length:180 start_codon:yes stop_codon:yes gene_type:complete
MITVSPSTILRNVAATESWEKTAGGRDRIRKRLSTTRSENFILVSFLLFRFSSLNDIID